jgi:hypothetical protein
MTAGYTSGRLASMTAPWRGPHAQNRVRSPRSEGALHVAGANSRGFALDNVGIALYDALARRADWPAPRAWSKGASTIVR